VLAELVGQCRELRPAALLLCGDIFDTRRDAAQLAEAFRDALGGLAGIPVLMIPGNHEALGDDTPLAPAELAPATLLAGLPLATRMLGEADVEVVGLPFRHSFDGYLDWPLPPRQTRWRVGLLHGVVNGMCYTGDSAEAEQSIIDPHLFQHLGLDYAALGHIHRRGEQRHQQCLAHYPGSARVWRRGEEGPRQATRVTLGPEGVRTAPLPLTAAGRYVPVTLPISPDGSIAPMAEAAAAEPAAWLDALGERVGAQDWVEVRLSGFVEQADVLLPLTTALSREGGARFRRFDVDPGGILEASALAGHPMVQAFDGQWRARLLAARERQDTAAEARLLLARQVTLELLQSQLGGD
jgi:predicted phosphodiesterase